MAMESPWIVADVIEANEFPELSERYAVTTVPKTIVNGRLQLVGPRPEAQLLGAIREAVARETREDVQTG